MRKVTKDKATPFFQTLAFSMSFLKEIPAKHQATVSAVLQHADLPLEAKLEMLRTMKLEESVISKAADHLRPDFRLLLTESRRQVVNFLLKQEDWIVLKRVISGESTEIQASYSAFLEKVAENGGRVPADPSEPAEGPPSSTNRPKEAQNSGQKNQGNEAKAEKKSRFFDGFPKEMNILLLGMEGSGKAEFINSFPNYLKYENLDKALKNGPEVVIPKDSFQLSRETQKFQVYSFMAEKAQKYLQFIDTPVLSYEEERHWLNEQQKHLVNVLELVKNFGQIHAILIFVRSDEKHSYSYTRYLERAFHHLHYQASKNIIFCFPSEANPRKEDVGKFTRWPFNFKAGHDVRPAKNNTFCFENYSYRLLCAQKEGVPLSENAISVGRKLWTLSAQETFRLLGHIKTLTPFSNSTLNTIFELMLVLSEFFVSRIVEIVVADEEIQKLEKGSILQRIIKEEDLRTLKERSDGFKRSFPKLVDFCVKLNTCFQQNVLVYNGLFDDYLMDLFLKKVTNEEVTLNGYIEMWIIYGGSFWEKISTAEVKCDPSIKTMVTTYFEWEMKHYKKEKETYMNYLQKTGGQITLEEITAKELPAIVPYFAEESKEWKHILTKKQVRSRPHSAKLITIKNDW